MRVCKGQLVIQSLRTFNKYLNSKSKSYITSLISGAFSFITGIVSHQQDSTQSVIKFGMMLFLKDTCTVFRG